MFSVFPGRCLVSYRFTALWAHHILRVIDSTYHLLSVARALRCSAYTPSDGPSMQCLRGPFDAVLARPLRYSSLSPPQGLFDIALTFAHDTLLSDVSMCGARQGAPFGIALWSGQWTDFDFSADAAAHIHPGAVRRAASVSARGHLPVFVFFVFV